MKYLIIILLSLSSLLVSAQKVVTIKVGDKIDTTSLSNRVNTKVNYTDTATMLRPYAKWSDTINTIATKSNINNKFIPLIGSNVITGSLTMSNTTGVPQGFYSQQSIVHTNAGLDVQGYYARLFLNPGYNGGIDPSIEYGNTTSNQYPLDFKFNDVITHKLYPDGRIKGAPATNDSDFVTKGQANATYQPFLTLTTSGSGAATLIGSTLNIPNVSGGTAVEDSTFTPTFTSISNVASFTPGMFHYSKTSKSVTMWGQCLMAPVIVGTVTYNFNLPYISNFTDSGDLVGTAQTDGTTGYSGSVQSVISGTQAIAGHYLPGVVKVFISLHYSIK